MKRVLVLDADQRCALAVTRSLGRRNIPVFTAEDAPEALAGRSRFSEQYIEYPSPKSSPEQFVGKVIDCIKQHQIDILFPMTELTTSLLLNNDDIRNRVIIPFPDKQTVDSIADKSNLMRIAEELGVPVPETRYVDNTASMPVNFDEMEYPLVLKPGRSWFVHQGRWSRAAVHIANNAADAKQLLDTETYFTEHPFLLQECVDGHGEGVFAIYNHGQPLTFFAHRRIREKPPRGGVSVLSESITVDPTLKTCAQQLLDKANWHGVAMVEFKVTSDGTPYLMEINTRFWGSLQLAIDAGVDFPWLLYQLACDEHPEIAYNYTKGKRLRWLLGDIDNLYLTLRDKQYTFGDKLGALARFLTPSPFKTKHEINRWNDPGPAWFELKQYVKDLLS